MNEYSAMLSDTADRILGENPPGHGFDRPRWAAMAEAGFDRLLAPEAEGGAGDAFAEAAAVARQAGQHVAAIPLLETMVANWCLGKAGISIPDGPKALLLCLKGSIEGSGPRIRWRGVVNSVFEPVCQASVAIVQTPEGVSVALIEEPLPGEESLTLAGDPLRQAMGEDGIAVARMAPSPLAPDQPLALLALLKAAAISGAAEKMLDMTVDYSQVRHQFGRPLAAFQAIQHMIARMAEEAAASAAAVQHGAINFAGQGAVIAAGIAKGRASEAVATLVANAHQVHGAIGYTAEHDLNRYSRRLMAWREEAGHEGFWYERIGRLACARPEGSLWNDIVGGFVHA